jgi:hypothetical protein
MMIRQRNKLKYELGTLILSISMNPIRTLKHCHSSLIAKEDDDENVRRVVEGERERDLCTGRSSSTNLLHVE